MAPRIEALTVLLPVECPLGVVLTGKLKRLIKVLDRVGFGFAFEISLKLTRCRHTKDPQSIGQVAHLLVKGVEVVAVDLLGQPP